MSRLIRQFTDDARGATSIEYAMIILIIGIGIISVLNPLPGSLNAIWGGVTSSLN
ncbi:MAG TPA: Flp family type IVb pilin [Hyphomicrobiaceae bacterium]|nr:Flp family type IVb pilin [Hyphomicrobiaceae bacterium]